MYQRVAMRRFNNDGVMSPIGEPVKKNVNQMSRQPVLVSFETDYYSNPQTVTAYGNGFDCWWIKAARLQRNER